MRGVGRTVFSGNRVDEFQVEILGVLDNFGPKESLIIARLSGGPLEHAGVLQGMSGSPVFIGGKLAGAVAMAFPFAKDPIAGVRPIEDMIRQGMAPPPPPPSRRSARLLNPVLAGGDLTHAIPPPRSVLAGGMRMVDIATPISFGGFTPESIEAFAPQLRGIGLEPRQGITAGSKIAPPMGNPADLKPGSMISVQLMSGDMSVAADGTVTWIDGRKIYAFGHRFLDIGATALPFARSEVIALVPNLNSSFKVTAGREWMGTIDQDRNTAIAGELGRRAPTVPVTLSVARAAPRSTRPIESYAMQMVNDPLLSPLLIQMAVYSAIDATERTVGAASIRVTGEIEFQNAPAPLRLNNMFAGDNGSAMQVSFSTAVPLAYVMQSDFHSLRLKKVALKIEAFDQKKELSIDGVVISRQEVHPGDKLRLTVVLAGENGSEVTRHVDYQVPIGAQPGPLYFTVADAGTTNLADFRQIVGATPRTPEQLITTVNDLHSNNKAYIRVWRADPAFQLEGADLPDPPPSVALILAGSQSSLAGITQTRNAKVAEMEIDGGDSVITGAKTVQVEIKE